MGHNFFKDGQRQSHIKRNNKQDAHVPISLPFQHLKKGALPWPPPWPHAFSPAGSWIWQTCRQRRGSYHKQLGGQRPRWNQAMVEAEEPLVHQPYLKKNNFKDIYSNFRLLLFYTAFFFFKWKEIYLSFNTLPNDHLAWKSLFQAILSIFYAWQFNFCLKKKKWEWIPTSISLPLSCLG